MSTLPRHDQNIYNTELRQEELTQQSRLNAWIVVCSDRLLCLDQSGHEDVDVGWVDVADGDDAQVCCGGGVEGEA
jgi:hypothetical protein